jgi:hypothetical protein
MRKSFAILAAVVMLLGVANVTFATQSRVASLGKAWMYDGDFEDIYFYPNLTASYPRTIVAELGTNPDSISYNGSAAITFANEEQTWGVVGLDINHKITNEDGFNTLITNAFGMAPVNNKWHLFYARNVGGLSVGLHIARAAYDSTYTYTDTVTNFTPHEDNTSSAGIWDFNFGLGYSPAENMEANLGFSFKTYSFSDEMNLTWPNVTPAITPYTETLESDGGSGIDVALQVLYGMNDNFKLVPTAGISMASVGYKISDTDTLIPPIAQGGEMSSFDFWAGFGANYTPVENVRVIGGLHFGISNTTIEDTMGRLHTMGLGYTEVKTSTFLFPGFSAAVEADVLKWLTLRIGASKDIAKTTETITTAANTEIESTYTSAAYQFGFGLGFKFNKLCIDVKVNDAQPFDLGYLMSGNPNTPFTQVSATYKF